MAIGRLIFILTVIFSLVAISNQTWTTGSFYDKFAGYEADANKKAICSYFWDNWPSDATYKMSVDVAGERNWFDMSPTNMDNVMDDALGGTNGTFKNWYEMPDELTWGQTGEKEWTEWQQTENNDYSAYTLHGERLGYYATQTENDPLHLVVWLVKKNRVAFRERNQKDSDFLVTYLKTGEIQQIICTGRYVFGTKTWSVARSRYEVKEPFDSFLKYDANGEPIQTNRRYYHGHNCPNIPPIVPYIPDDVECTWAIRLGKYFVDFRLEDSVIAGDASLGGLLECIQKIYGKRTHTQDCFYGGMDLNSDPNVVALNDTAFSQSNLYTADEKAIINQTAAAYDNSSSSCVYFEEVGSQYRCKCDFTRLPETAPENLYEWSHTIHRWTPNSKYDGYKCDNFRPREERFCLDWSKNADGVYDDMQTGHCTGCKSRKTKMYLGTNLQGGQYSCIRHDYYDTRTFPANCYSAREKDDNGTQVLECQYCDNGFHMTLNADNLQECTANTADATADNRVDHCEMNMGDENGQLRCYQCNNGYVLVQEKNQSDVCMNAVWTTTDHFPGDYQYFANDYSNCRRLWKDHPRYTTMPFLDSSTPNMTVSQIPVCEQCKYGFEQSRYDNKKCQRAQWSLRDTNEKELVERRTNTTFQTIDSNPNA